MGGLAFWSSCHVVLARQGRRASCACGLAAVCGPVTACAAPCPFGFPGNPAQLPERIMNDKSHVSLERRVCLACGSPFDTGNILLDKRLRQSMAHHTVTGWGLCPEHERMFEEGFIALVECDPRRSGAPSSGRIDPEQAYRTGRLAHLRREVFAKVFNVPISAQQPCVFVEPEVIDHLQAMIAPASK
jgi:hypothetical protein